MNKPSTSQKQGEMIDIREKSFRLEEEYKDLQWRNSWFKKNNKNWQNFDRKNKSRQVIEGPATVERQALKEQATERHTMISLREDTTMMPILLFDWICLDTEDWQVDMSKCFWKTYNMRFPFVSVSR